MGLFNSGPKVTQTIKDEKATFSIRYNKAKVPEEYKDLLLVRILGDSAALAFLNSKFMYKEQKYRFLERQQELFEKLNNLGIDYKRISIERKSEVSIFGLTVRQTEDKYYQDYVYGLIIDSSNAAQFIKLSGEFNLHYFFNCEATDHQKMLELFEASHDDAERLKAQFRYSIFDDNFMQNLVISCKEQDVPFISSILT